MRAYSNARPHNTSTRTYQRIITTTFIQIDSEIQHEMLENIAFFRASVCVARE